VAKQDNEGKALDAVLRFIEGRDNALRKNDGWSPDEPKDPDPDPLRRVDYVCTVGRLLYAFEHTRIEPFIDQIALRIHNQNLFDPIIERFDHRADREFWELIVPVDASAGLTVTTSVRCKTPSSNGSRRTLRAFQSPRSTTNALTPPLGESAAGVPFRFSLHRASLEGPYYPSDSPLRGRFRWAPIAPANLEQAWASSATSSCPAAVGWTSSQNRY
jgi:hypothetical protein